MCQLVACSSPTCGMDADKCEAVELHVPETAFQILVLIIFFALHSNSIYVFEPIQSIGLLATQWVTSLFEEEEYNSYGFWLLNIDGL